MCTNKEVPSPETKVATSRTFPLVGIPKETTSMVSTGAEHSGQMNLNLEHLLSATTQGMVESQEIASSRALLGMTVGDIVSRIPVQAVTQLVAAQAHQQQQQIIQQQQQQPQSKGTRDIRAIQRHAKERKSNRSIAKEIITEDYPHDSEIAKKRRRMVKNRESAARSRQRKQEHVERLEKKVAALQKENCELRQRVETLEEDRSRSC